MGSQHTGAHCCADKCLPLSALDARDDGELGLAQSGSARHSTCFLVIRHVFGIRGSVCVVVVIIMAFFDGQKLKNNLKAQRHFAKHKATAAWSKVRLLLEEGTPLCTCVSDFRSPCIAARCGPRHNRSGLARDSVHQRNSVAVCRRRQPSASIVFISDHCVRFRACAPISRVQFAFFVHARDASPVVLVQVCSLLCVRRFNGCSSRWLVRSGPQFYSALALSREMCWRVARRLSLRPAAWGWSTTVGSLWRPVRSYVIASP